MKAVIKGKSSEIEVNAGMKIEEGDCRYLIEKEPVLSAEDLKTALFSRQPFAITEKLRKACVGIAGAGGLGTVVAEELAMAAVAKNIIADFDVVEPSNLNRQRFFLSQLGMPKVNAAADNMKQINPFVEVLPIREKVTALNCAGIFDSCFVVAECFDNAANKAAFVACIRSSLPRCFIVAASGLSGIGSGNKIRTRKITDRLYVVGDMVSDVDDRAGLFASRVGIAASMQAHVMIRLIAGEQL